MNPIIKPISRGVSPVGRGTRLLLVLALLFSEISGVHSAGDLWSERREAVRLARTVSASHRASPLEKLAAAFPLMNNGAPLLPPVPSSRAAFPDWLASAVALHADVGESHLPAPGEHRVLIHIQDLHDVEEAQRNTAAILEQLAESLGGTKGLLVGLEGAVGGFRTADIKALAFPPVIRQAAHRMLKAGLISGPEYFSLTTETPVRLWGAEDSFSYEKNIQALTDTFPRQAKDDALMAQALSRVAELKERIYPDELKELDRLRNHYDDGNVGLVPFVKKLSSGAPADWMGENLRVFLEALNREDGLTFSRVTEEQTRLLEKLTPLLNESEVRQLVERGLAHRWGRSPFSRFQALLDSLCTKHSVSLRDYPALLAYADYAMKAEGVNPVSLLHDVESLSDRRFQSYLTSPQLTALASVDADARLIDKLNRFVLRPEEYKRVVSRRDSLLRWHERGAALGTGAWPDLGPVVLGHETFYVYAEARNRPLVQNLLSLWTTDFPAVLVAGGYHGDGVRAAALSEGLGYVSLIPRVITTKEFPPPLASFRRESAPSSWVFPGDRAALHNRQQTSALSPDFLYSMLGLVTAVTAANVFRGKDLSPLSVAPLVRNSLKRLITGARALGLEVDLIETRSAERGPDGTNRVEIALSVQSGPTVLISFSVERDGPETAEITVRIVPPSWFGPLVQRVKILQARGVTAALSYGLRDRAAGIASTLSSKLRRATQKSATVAVKGIRPVAVLFKLKRLRAWVGRWENILKLVMERKYLQSEVLPTPFGLRTVLLSNLAAAHLVKLEAVWKEEILEHFGFVPPGEGSETTSDNFFIQIRKTFDGGSAFLRFHVTEARVLEGLPNGGALFQIARRESGFDVYLHTMVMSSDSIRDRVLGQVLRIVEAQSRGVQAEEAHSSAIGPLDRVQNTLDTLALGHQVRVRDFDNALSRGGGRAVLLNMMDVTAASLASVWADPRDSLPFVGGENAWTPSLSDPAANFRLFDYVLHPANPSWPDEIKIRHLKNAIATLTLLSNFVSLRRERSSVLSWFATSNPLVDRVSELILAFLSTVGMAHGREAAFGLRGPVQPGSSLLQNSLAASVSDRFLPLAHTLLAALSLSGVSVDNATPAAQNAFVTDMFRVYAKNFQAGFLEISPVASSLDQAVNAFPGTATSLVAGVADMSPGLNSPAGELLAESLVRRESLDHYRILVLSEKPKDEVRSSLVEVLEKMDSERKTDAIKWLAQDDSMAVVPLSDVKIEGKISVAAVLQQVETAWSGSVKSLNFYTPDASTVLFDAEGSDVSWAIYDQNLFLVSESMAIEDAKRAIQNFIRQQA
jgi:hypothetical protein